jgi:hypothetical protein
MQIVRFVVVVGWRRTKASKQARNLIFKVVFCTNSQGNFKGKEREGMQKNPNFYFKKQLKNKNKNKLPLSK